MKKGNMADSDSESLLSDISLEMSVNDFSFDEENECEQDASACDLLGNAPYRFEPYEDENAGTSRRDDADSHSDSNVGGETVSGMNIGRLQNVEW